MTLLESYLLEIEKELRPYHDIEDLVVKETKDLGGGESEVRYEFHVVSRLDRRWLHRRTQNRMVEVWVLRDNLIKQIIY
jgi:hypothetical protein